MNIPMYRIHHILKVYTDCVRQKKINIDEHIVSINTLHNEFSLSFDGKKKQLIDQVISESIAQLATVSEKKESKIGEGIPHDIFAEDGRRKLYGTPS